MMTAVCFSRSLYFHYLHQGFNTIAVSVYIQCLDIHMSIQIKEEVWAE